VQVHRTFCHLLLLSACVERPQHYAVGFMGKNFLTASTNISSAPAVAHLLYAIKFSLYKLLNFSVESKVSLALSANSCKVACTVSFFFLQNAQGSLLQHTFFEPFHVTYCTCTQPLPSFSLGFLQVKFFKLIMLQRP